MADEKKSMKSIKARAEAKAAQMAKAKASGRAKSGKRQNSAVKFFKDLRSELKKVVWPSKPKVLNNTAVVLIGMCASGIVIWGIDTGLAALVKLMVNLNA